MRIYPEKTSNKNVPSGYLLLAEIPSAPKGTVTTYYVDAECRVYRSTDQLGHSPERVPIGEVFQVTGKILPSDIVGRVMEYYRGE